MRTGVNKGNPKGPAYGRIKSSQKLGKIVEEKKRVRQIENAKKNSTRRKEKEAKRETYELIDEIQVVDFVKNSFIISKEGQFEKRVFNMPKGLNKKNMEKMEELVTLTLYGEEVALADLNCNDDVIDKLLFFLGDKI